MLGNSKTYTNRRESHEMEVTWPEQPRFTNAIAIVFYGMPVLVFLTCVIIMSQCSNLVSSGRYYMLSPPPQFQNAIYRTREDWSSTLQRTVNRGRKDF